MNTLIADPTAVAFRDSLKRNALELAAHHKETCPGGSCGVSLWLLGLLIQAAGIELTDEERDSLL